MRKRKRKNHKKKYQPTDRVTEWKKERKKRIRVRVRFRDKMKILEERKTVKTIIYQKYVYRGDKKINKMKK